jgi:hypothetical protein
MSLNKAERLKAKRRKARANNEAKPLNPPFPFHVLAFDPAFLRLDGAGK